MRHSKMASITLNGKKVLCNSVQISGKKTIDTKPYANFPSVTEPVEVQTLPYENLKIVLQGVKFPATTDNLSDTDLFRYTDLLDYYATKYDGTNGKYTLTVAYGKDTNYTLPGLGSTSGIPVVVESFSMPIDARDSIKGYLPSASVTLVETK